MNRSHLIPVIAVVLSMLSACGSTKQNTIKLTYKDYDIGKTYVPDTGVLTMLTPYRDSVDKTMGKIIGNSAEPLKKKLPESNLGNFMADCMRTISTKKFNRSVDAAFVNYGGIRGELPQGPIQLRHIYELMPFDNLVVLQQVKGSVLQQFLDHIASRGGWPVSGITMGIKDKTAVNVLVNGKPIDANATYTIANSDYVANGGDDCVMLKTIPQVNIGYLYRDALIEYVRMFTAQQQPIQAKIENRVTNVN